jgi:hypothetical protein
VWRFTFIKLPMSKEFTTVSIAKFQYGFDSATLEQLKQLSFEGWEVLQFVDNFVVLQRSIGKVIKAPRTKNE